MHHRSRSSGFTVAAVLRLARVTGMTSSSQELDPLPHGLPVRFSDLAIPGGSDAEQLVPTLASSMLDLLTIGPLRRALTSRIYKHNTETEDYLIQGAEGVVDQGELLLIVGPPTSNASLLLRALTSPSDLKLPKFSRLDYGLLAPSFVQPTSPLPFGQAKDAGLLRSQIVYMNPHDVHFATLSLQSSMKPASLAKAPSGKVRPSKISRKRWANEKLEELVHAVGLSHAMYTKVGSPLVNGLSGGERKRASVVEVLLTRASVLCLDAFTSGLDSSTAYSLIVYLRSWAQRGKRTLIATAPHISDPLFTQFDKVLVLSSTGEQIFFGRTDEAQTYFEGLGLGFKRRTAEGEGVAEFLVGCVEGRGNDAQLVRAWQRSAKRKVLTSELQGYDRKYPKQICAQPLIEALKREKSRFATGHYIVSFPYQIFVLTRRQYALIYSELPGYVTKTTVNLLLSVTVGSLFFRLPVTSEGAFTRGSLLLLSIMFNAYLSLAELGKAIEGREIVKRQRDYGFFGSSALAVARVLGDLPLILAQCLLFGTVTYFMAGLQLDFTKFIIYILFIYATALNLSCMFRMFAAFSPNFESAIRFCGICLNVLVIFAGYFIPTPSIPKGIRWFHYILDPIARSYEAVLANEFHNLDLECSPVDIVPRGAGYPTNGANQACLLSGSAPNTLIVSGDSYLAVAYDFHYDKIWTNLGVMAGQALIFLIIGVIATEFLHFAPEGTKRIWKPTRSVVRSLRRLKGKADEEEPRLAKTDFIAEEDSTSALGDAAEDDDDTMTSLAESQGCTLTWRNVCLWVDTPTETRRLLDHVTGFIRPGRVCALLGVSGAGKSTLLNVLAGRPIGVVRGTVLVDGVPFDDDVRRTTAFAEQFDLHDDRATVREALEFSALLRCPTWMSRDSKLSYVDEVLDLLNLTHLQDAIIGTSSAGLNPEQRKRVTIAVEVVSRPKILFCDEPTTGLDTKAAHRVVRLLKKLSRTGLAIICTIHQPTAETFNVFDDVLLLQRGGKQIYFGPRSAAVEYFTGETTKNEHLNPADFLLDVAGAGLRSAAASIASSQDDGEANDVLATKWKCSKQAIEIQQQVEKLSENTKKSSATQNKIGSTSNFTQCIELTRRVSRHYWRDPSFSYTKLFTSTIVPLIIGLSFWRVGTEQTIVSFDNRLFSVFLLLFVPVVWLNVIIFKIFKLRGLWEARERPSKIYGRTAFVTSLLVAEFPYSIVCASLYWILWYFLVGFPLEATTIGFSFLLIQIFFLFQSSWAFWIVALSQEIGTIANLLPFFLVAMEAFNGALMPYKQMPRGWKWLYWISPFQYYVRAMLAQLLHNQPIRCATRELATFDPPFPQSCQDYLANYLAEFPGYLQNPTSFLNCEFCKFSSGDEFLASINLNFDDRWWAMSVLAAYCFINVILAYLLVFYPLQSWVPGLKTRSSGATSRAELVANDWEQEVELRQAEILAERGRI